jgi:DNA-binding transcriptional ArsR family regulator
MASRRFTDAYGSLVRRMPHNMPLVEQERFVYDQSMDAPTGERAISNLASAIGEPARTRMLFCLMDGRARSSTELAIVAQVGPATASVHLKRLRSEKLVKVVVQGKHRYYSLQGPEVAAALEGLSVLAGGARAKFVPSTPSHLRGARTCYDHIAGTLGVSLHDRLKSLGWLTAATECGDDAYELTPKGVKALEALGVDVESTRMLRRHFAYACLDWSERRPHVGGALGAALLKLALKRKWVVPDLDSRALSITDQGRREMLARLEMRI